MSSVHLIDIDIDIDTHSLVRTIFVYSVGIQLFLILADLVFNYLDIFNDLYIRRIWNIAREQSIPTWYASIQAQLVGVTVLLIAWLEKQQRRSWRVTVWTLIGLFFIWIGIDDYAEIHEKLGGSLEDIFVPDHNDEPVAFLGLFLSNPSASWHSFIAPIYALFGLGILGFTWRRARSLGYLKYLLTGFACWGVSQGIDFIEGLEHIDETYERIQAALQVHELYLITHTFKVVEEALEMFGTTLLWLGFLHELRGRLHRVTLTHS